LRFLIAGTVPTKIEGFTMRITDLNWMQVEAYLQNDDRAVVPLGSTEQHAYLSLSVDSILSERVALEAAEPLQTPVFPVLHYGCTPYFMAYGGTVSLRLNTYFNILRDLLDSLAATGFKRILLVNGHGGNSPGAAYAGEWMADHPGVQVKWYDWWRGPQTWAKVQAIDPQASHASWMENFPWTRLPGVEVPAVRKVVPARAGMPALMGQALRDHIGDGNFEGLYVRPDEEMLALWAVAVEETRALITGGWD
jgi:creatinine amidohydrolase